MKKLNMLGITLGLVISSFSLFGCSQQATSSSSSEPRHHTDPSTILDGYYKDLTHWDNYIDLKRQLYNICHKDFAAIPYTQDPEDPTKANWSTNRNADQSLKNHDMVDLLYTDKDEFKQTGTTSNWQREHCFPASLMTGLSTGEAVKNIGTATDFHNLMASYSSANSAHSNMSYGYVNPNSPMEIKTTGNCKYQEDNPETWNNDGVFEPADEDKGRTSRAIFYIGLMYGNDSWVQTTDAAGHTLSTGIQIFNKTAQKSCSLYESGIGNKCHSNKEDLLEWNNKILPDRLEYQHCTYVQSVQHNRNPFVDFPGLVDYCFGDKMLEEGNLSDLDNIYDILDLGSEEVSEIAVKNAKYTYDGGDKFDSSTDVEVYATTKSFKRTKLEKGQYTIEGVVDGANLSSQQNGQTVYVGYQNKYAKYEIGVASEAWKDCNYVGLPTYSLVSYRPQQVHSLKMNNMLWDFDAGDASSSSVLDVNCKEIGVNIGSSGTPAHTITLQTNGPVEFEGNSVAKQILVEANSSSSWSGGFTCNIYLDNEKVYTRKVSYSSRSMLQSLGVTLSPLTQGPGVIKIEFTGVNTGFRLGRIGLLVEKTSD